MIKVDTGIPIVHRFDDIITTDNCRRLCEAMLQSKGINKKSDFHKLPWFEDDAQKWQDLKDIDIKRIVDDCRVKITEAVCESFDTTVWPTLTAMVIWRSGKRMVRHKDNGYKDRNETWLYHRTHTAVLYLNDDYKGGETFIHTKWGIYLSKPKTGSMVCFPSDESAEHGVNKVFGGIRFTLPIWFCTEEKFAEDIVFGEK